MRVVFVLYGRDSQYAKLMVRSCKRLGYEVWQLSDYQAPMIEGVDHIERRPMEEGRMIYRCRRLSQLMPPYVMLDTDMLVVRPIEGGFEPDTDVSLTWREKHTVIMKNQPPTKMPYNGGVIFVRNANFMSDCLSEMEKMHHQLQDWYGDQIALRDVVDNGKYKVNVLKEPGWNFCPEHPEHIGKTVRIYHFKGQRKALMNDYAEKLGI